MTDFVDQFPGPRITLNGKPFLYFGGTAYLGLQHDPDFHELYIQNIRRYGTHYGASRKSNLRMKIFDTAEQMLSKKIGADSALTLSSGYLVGQLLATYFHTPGFSPFYAPGCHAALFQTEQAPFTSYQDLALALKEHLSRNTDSIPVIFFDTLESKEAYFPDFEALKKLPLDRCILVADDSHGFGILGERGMGAYARLSEFAPRALLVCFSLGKAIGIPAGAVIGSKNLVEALKRTVFFGAASPASPAGLATLTQAWELLLNKRKNLIANVEHFLSGISNKNPFWFTPGIPAFSYQDPGLTAFLKEQSIIVTHFHYPNEEAEPTSRIVITAAHEIHEIDKLTQSINAYFAL
ncbi:MAG: pyridoxal phosphate-dependent aminotransferase family protein [Flavobacteriaceae bacterium]|nr:pyridoxal phosphate-dependent aminotransferase family protein [Eudoraea sp.]NNJ38087.1 pyridoxal phosphate-dependent aminotransferase family protein [Flavobacteriaceae bacterium]